MDPSKCEIIYAVRGWYKLAKTNKPAILDDKYVNYDKTITRLTFQGDGPKALSPINEYISVLTAINMTFIRNYENIIKLWRF